MLVISLHGALAMGSAHGDNRVSAMVICAGEGTQILWIDHAGNPVNPEQPNCACVNCICASTFDLPSDFPKAPDIVPKGAPILWMALDQFDHDIRVLGPIPRGPPRQAEGTLDWKHLTCTVDVILLQRSRVCSDTRDASAILLMASGPKRKI